MPNQRQRWEDVNLRVFLDGVELGVYFATSFSYDELVQVDPARYQGATTPSLDGTYQGGNGRIEFRLDGRFADPDGVVRGQIKHLKERTAGGDVRIVMTRPKPGSQTLEGRRFDGVVFSRAGERAGDNQEVMPSWDFSFENMERI